MPIRSQFARQRILCLLVWRCLVNPLLWRWGEWSFSISMVVLEINIQWWWSRGGKTIEKPSVTMVPWEKNITIPSLWKNDHRWSLPAPLPMGSQAGNLSRRLETSVWFLAVSAKVVGKAAANVQMQAAKLQMWSSAGCNCAKVVGRQQMCKGRRQSCKGCHQQATIVQRWSAGCKCKSFFLQLEPQLKKWRVYFWFCSAKLLTLLWTPLNCFCELH